MRAQTQLDFAIGISIFLIVVAFVLSFVPAMLQPFESSTQQETSAANRVADQLVGGTLGDPGEPYVLDRECTIVFFEDRGVNTDGNDVFDEPLGGGETYAASNCNFDDVGVIDRVGLNTNPSLNVRMHVERDVDADGVVETLCYSADTEEILESDEPDCGSSSDDVEFVIGDSPPTDIGSVVVARRTVSVRGGFADNTSDASLIVEVW